MVGVTSNLGARLPCLPGWKSDRATSMDAFDRLPPALREVAREMPVQVSPIPILNVCGRYPEKTILHRLAFDRARIEQAMRDEMAEALAR